MKVRSVSRESRRNSEEDVTKTRKLTGSNNSFCYSDRALDRKIRIYGKRNERESISVEY